MVDNTKGWKQLVAVLMFRRVSPDLEALHPIRKVAPRGEFNFGVRFTRLQRFCASSSTPTSTSTSESSLLKPMTPYYRCVKHIMLWIPMTTRVVPCFVCKARKAIGADKRTIKACDCVSVMNGSSFAIIRRNDGSKAAQFGFALTALLFVYQLGRRSYQ